MTTPNIRFVVLSDTHDSAFPSELPLADVVIHCGDLTMIGGMSNYKAAIKSLSDCNAELKLAIPGNHDISLDPTWWANNSDEDDDPEEPKKAIELFTQSGISLLSEGLHSFTLNDGRSFTLYASPYTPEFNGYAFSYGPDEDRFSPAETAGDCERHGINTHGPNPISENVDIVVTHGSPQVPGRDYRLDLDSEGAHCGCPKLWKAIERIRPRVHCFGHLHEGYGSQMIEWGADSSYTIVSPVIEGVEITTTGDTENTLLVNAAIMNHKGNNNRPWVIDM
ncbi:hypothetical protein CORC01_03494 [Colletotrichum orchidophilum]|uniref:Calcineurin-like phosphoesterase domain-containing protein n=1 Tax=Colletotrichum orchidophilum TaxID=1209926 RepID=A0A1G4BIB2_9PEZI|nr:uncharacterized protein CORC01_03494 [Colletotrichum orchidophilum]OHF01179.1 hypothetical protein CORC01_03494 [Colletotrichum orchidophilum]